MRHRSLRLATRTVCVTYLASAPMDAPSRPAPKFSSFIAPAAPASSSSVAGPIVPRDDPDHEERSVQGKKRHHRRSRSPRDRTRAGDFKSRDSRKEKRRPRHDELRAMDNIATRPVTSQLEDRTRRPAQFTLDDSGVSYYEDPFGATGALYMEVKYWPPAQGEFRINVVLIAG